jgi:sirohydrochlorin cobaltochelatase
VRVRIGGTHGVECFTETVKDEQWPEQSPFGNSNRVSRMLGAWFHAPRRDRLMIASLILYAHGSRDPQWSKPLEIMREHITRSTPGLQVAVAYLEFQPPSLDEVVSRLAADVIEGAGRVRVMPMFLGQGGHLRRDVAERIAQAAAAHPQVQLELMPSLGESDQLLEAMARWIAARAIEA